MKILVEIDEDKYKRCIDEATLTNDGKLFSLMVYEKDIIVIPDNATVISVIDDMSLTKLGDVDDKTR